MFWHLRPLAGGRLRVFILGLRWGVWEPERGSGGAHSVLPLSSLILAGGREGG